MWTVKGLCLPRVDFYFEPERRPAMFGFNLVDEFWRDNTLRKRGITKPVQNFAESIKNWTDRAMRGPDKVDVFRVTQRFRKMKLVERCTTAKAQLLTQSTARREIDLAFREVLPSAR